MKQFSLVHRIRAAVRAKSGGQALVEFALVIPVFLFLVVGIVDLGRAIADYTVVSNAAHEGARRGIFPGTLDSDIRDAMRSQTSLLGTVPDADMTIAPQPVGAQTLLEARPSGGNITVTMTYAFHPVTPLISNLIGSSINLSATSTMPIE